ncbi:MAG TPA: NTP transferase domain-containing protein [Chthoniobacterales bacterium]
MAGSGSRLRTNGMDLPKPLVPVFGRPLILYALEALTCAGIKKVHFVIGFERELIKARLRFLIPAELEGCFIENRDWQKQNGISVLTAANHVEPPFLLMMSDHLFDQSILDLLLRTAVPDQVNLAIDRKLDSIFDLTDAMKVRTCGDRIIEMGKALLTYDAIDTGLFVCPAEIFSYLERVRRNGDCSLADGVRLMAREDKVRGLDIGEAWWQDVDTPAMLERAEEQMRTVSQFKNPALAIQRVDTA